MKRPLFAIGLAFLCASWLAFSFDCQNALLLSAAASLSAVFFFLMRAKWPHARTVCIVFLSCSAAFVCNAMYVNRAILPAQELAGHTVAVEGLITEVDSGIKSTSYMMKATFVDFPELPANMSFMLQNIDELENKTGDTIRCNVQIIRPADSVWYKSRGISVIGRNASHIENIPAGRFRYERAVLRFRESLAINVYEKLSRESADVVSAMVLGMKNNVSPQVYSAVGRSGTSHLLSISGLHLSIISAFILGLFKKLRCPGRLSAALAIIVSFFFVGLVGFSASIFRSFVMTALALCGRIISKRSDSLTSLGTALLICCGVWPYWALSWGLWLSAGSTLGIILFGGKFSEAAYERLKRGNPAADCFIKAFAGAGAISVSAYIFTLPVLLLMSGWISLISPLANILIAPFVPVSILGGMACALIPGADAPVKIIAAGADLATKAIIRISEILSKLPFAVIALDESYLLLWLAGLCAFAAVIIVYRRDKKLAKSLTAYAMALAVAIAAVGELSLNRANRDKLELVSFSSRQAAVLIRGSEAVILGTPDAYEITNLLRYLNFRGIRAIPAVIAADCGDTIGSGMLRLANDYKIDCIIAPDDAFIAEQLETALPCSIVYPGGYAQVTVLGGAKITTDLHNDNIYVSVGKNEIVKMREKCDIIEAPVSGGKFIEIYDGGVMLLPRRMYPAFEPVGGHLFGESRILLGM